MCFQSPLQLLLVSLISASSLLYFSESSHGEILIFPPAGGIVAGSQHSVVSFPLDTPPMCDFRKLNDMVLAALPFVEKWSRVQTHKDKLEVALAGVAALMLGVGSQYNHSLLAVLCSVAGHILAAGDPDAGDLSPAHWVPTRSSPCSVITWVL